jgi:hypothetical protein
MCLQLAACAGGEESDAAVALPTGAPFKSLAAAANAPAVFGQPRAGVPLKDGSVAFIAVDQAMSDGDEALSGPRSAVFLQPPGDATGAPSTPRLLYAGQELVSPLDIEVSLDERTLFVADYAGGSQGTGAIVRLSPSGDSLGSAADGWSPRGVTVGPDGSLYFSGINPESGEPGVFRLNGDAVELVYVGLPLVDPSGIAVFRDGRVLVSDTRLLEGGALLGDVDAGEAGVVLIDGAKASVFASGFATGFPAGIALTLDESTLIVSGQGPDRSDTVYLVSVSSPRETPAVVQDVFSQERDSSAGLKRSHDGNTFIWSSLSFLGGTIFRIEG